MSTYVECILVDLMLVLKFLIVLTTQTGGRSHGRGGRQDRKTQAQVDFENQK